MSNVPGRESFESMYAGKAPWDIGRPQKPFLDVADRVTGAVLDAGCGTGENALFFAGRGHEVVGIDFLEAPIERAKRKAAEWGSSATFMVKDALTLSTLDRYFDSVIDSGFFHVFCDEDRARYVEGLASVLKPGGRRGDRRVLAEALQCEGLTPGRFNLSLACLDESSDFEDEWYSIQSA
jgi:SAM-dependent methyltransferase